MWAPSWDDGMWMAVPDAYYEGGDVLMEYVKEGKKKQQEAREGVPCDVTDAVRKNDVGCGHPMCVWKK